MADYKDYTLHMIGNAHIDPAWLWRWQEGFEVVISTFKSIVNLMEENHYIIFTCSSAALYQWIERADPQLFEKIRQYVKEERWCIVGGWWIEPDCNIPSGEALVRQGLYGQRYFLEKFGVMAKVGYSPDSFGHNGMIPQILKKSGMDFYLFMRPSPEYKDLPGELFWWESADGSRVLSYRIPSPYNPSGRKIEEHIKEIAKKFKPSLTHLMCFYGMGDHGGGPTRKDIEYIQKLNTQNNIPNLKFSSPNIYFNQISSQGLKLPVVAEELHHYARGCYASVSEIKYNNRRTEHLLLTAEKLSAIAFMTAEWTYPQRELTRAWHNVLFNQFHDILSGTAIPEVYEDARLMHGEALHLASEALNYAMQAISSKVNTEGEGVPIILFNSLSWRRKAPVECELPWKDKSLYPHIQDDQKKFISSQLLESSNRGRIRIFFIADLPAFGYRVYHVLSRKIPDSKKEDSSSLIVTSNLLENKWISLKLDQNSGHFQSFYDKENSVEVLKGKGAVPIVIDDLSDAWGHGVSAFRNEIGCFNNAALEVLEKGPLRGRLRIRSKFNDSTLQQDVIIYRDSNIIECRLKVDWHEQKKTLKLVFPVNVANPEATYEIQYGHTTRPTSGEEEPALQWIDVSGDTVEGKYGLSLINDGKYSFDVKDSEMRLTVLRSSVYGYNPPKPNPDIQYMDQGIQKFTYALIPHMGNWQNSKVVRSAEELNVPPILLAISNHKGKLPPAKAFINVNRENIIVSVFKKAEDSDGLILRCYETAGVDTPVQIKLPHMKRSWSILTRANEIKTLKIPINPSLPISETDLIELPK